MFSQVLKLSAGLEHKHHAIPIIFSVVDVGLGGNKIKLFNKFSHRITAAVISKLFTPTNIAITVMRRTGKLPNVSNLPCSASRAIALKMA
jgi:hypothetical protein